MYAIRIEITEYHKDNNTCTARLQNGDLVSLDPFVSCGIKMTDDQYESGAGNELVGGKYLLTEYTVYVDRIVPHEGGIHSLC